MNKKTAKWLKIEADKLQPKVSSRAVKHGFTGQEIIDEGRTQMKDGQPIKPKNVYTATSNEVYTVDHYEVMKQLYKTKGRDAVNNYINGHRNTANQLNQ